MSHIDRHITSTQGYDELLALLQKEQGESFLESWQSVRELTVRCRKANVCHFLRFLRDHKQTQFKTLVDITGVDWPQREKRFDVVYHLLSLSKNMRLRVKVQVAEEDSVPSVTGIYSAANWYERETYDMFGIHFEDHPDLRRLLTDYGFDGHPLRKDFPLEGHVEVYYDKDEQRVAYKPVDLPQEFRHFDRQSDWRGVTGNSYLAEEDNVFDADEFSEEEQKAS